MTEGWRVTWEGTVEDDWLDELNHVNFLVYQRIADEGGLRLWKQLSGDRDVDGEGNEYVMTETQVCYLGELRLGDAVRVLTALCDHDEKRFQLLHHIVGPRGVAATVEAVHLSFHLPTRRVCPFPPAILAALAAVGPRPPEANPDLPLRRERPLS